VEAVPGRAEVVWAVSRLLESRGLDDLFAGAGDRAAVVHAVLADLVRGRAGRWHGALARAARRRGVTTRRAADHVAMLQAALEARWRDDLYHALGVPALAPEETLAARWREIEGQGTAIAQAVREAWAILREPARRGAYERWWLQALGPLAPVQGRRTSGGGSGSDACAVSSSAAAAVAVAASRAATSSPGTASGATAASRARPSRSRRRAPRGLP
jgi:hypothetical protein